jgi:hypothetical protein
VNFTEFPRVRVPVNIDFSKELIGRRALVTGTRGIGATIAQRLLDAGEGRGDGALSW